MRMMLHNMVRLPELIFIGKFNVDDAIKPMVTEFKKEHHMK